MSQGMAGYSRSHNTQAEGAEMTIPMNGGEQPPLPIFEPPLLESPEIFPGPLADLIPEEPLWDCE